jgi:hypothetical protein
MKYVLDSVILTLTLAASISVYSSPPLSLLEAHVVAGSSGLDLSGLDLCDELLLTVSDKTEDRVFFLEPVNSGYAVGEYLQLDVPPHNHSRPWLRVLYSYLRGLVGQSTTDWEGVSCEGNDIFLISEMFGSFLVASKDTPPIWRSVADQNIVGALPLYERFSIGFETISVIDRQSVFIGHEREPAAGLIFIFSPEPGRISDFIPIMSIPGYITPAHGSEDITGSDIHGDVLYTLHRSSRQICAQRITPPFKDFLGCRSFASTEKAEAYAYTSMTYGRAEGLAVTDDKLYVILDNNGDELISNGSSEALLFVFQNPWRPAAPIGRL